MVNRGIKRGGGRGGFPGAFNASITNRPTCGGNKKAGLAPTIQVPINILNTTIYSARPPNCCRTNAICCVDPVFPNRKLPNGNPLFGCVLNRPVQSKRTPYASNP